jgi:hypothetical protein
VLRLLSDENFDGNIVRGLFRRSPEIDLLRVQDVGLQQVSDPSILEWAAVEGRILLTHDRRTVPRFAFERVAEGKRMPGVFVVDDRMPIGQAIDELLLAVKYGHESDWNDLVTYFPLD